ncbi:MULTISPECIES: alanine racemase [Anaerotruncus]|uniref:alanine racemase n=1 Tax=Anaerotruncus TaxID=244127 RepID=UPI0008348EBA|nr:MULTISPECIES: alanine racemase [Anaerotruncus]
MKYEHDRTWAEISLDNLDYNYRTLSDLVGPGCTVMAVIKGNFYGNGAITAARSLEEAGCRWMGLATIEEAMELREKGITAEMLLLGPICPEHTKIAIDNNLTIPMLDYAYAREISKAARSVGKTVRAHMKVDTGMCRYGMMVSKNLAQCVDETMQIAALPGIELTGVFTHFASGGDPAEDAFTMGQLANYRAYAEALEARGLKLLRHCANSPVSLRFPEARYDMVRVGTLLCGFNPFGCGVELKPVMQVRARILSIKQLDPGDTIGYNRLFTCERPTIVAIIPFGFVDGIHRSASNRAQMLLHGKRVTLVGKICMDLCFLDITDVPEAKIGDVVTIFGEDSGVFLSPYEITASYPGSAPELSAVIGTRVPRFYLRGGKIVARD